MNSPLNALIAVAVGLWKASQLVRSPQRISLRWVVACFAISSMAFAVEPYAGTGVEGGVSGHGPIGLMWLAEALLLSMLYCLICVFVFSADQGPAARTQAIREAVPWAATLLAMGVLAAIAEATRHVDDSTAALALFRLVANVYTVYGIVICIMWMRRYGPGAQRWLSWGLKVASVGLGIIGVGAALIAVTMVLRLAGMNPPAGLMLPQPVVLTGNLVFLAGVVAPGVRVRWAAARVWWRHLRDYHRLRPLWMMLHRAFPEDALNRVPANLWWDTVSLRSVNRRFYRRVIECRDGLVRASGRLTVEATPAEPAVLAASLRQVLEGGESEWAAGAEGLDVHPVAIPADSGLDADVRELVALSRELRTV